ncbi:hypothetical protein HO133_000086 [Letharia lupina]|uniref:Uncharacterized protein n=1 Tax=Letharia lupina TaxID=560253 RepID=A0A8H6CGS5_9LECA|nr:uncharacterized protein HO133_000086 [Letharia lupina]KAF6223244.1 hypothetical protein HO133_000086 [Letharia lupina]
MAGNSWSKVPREIRDQIYINMVQGKKYVLVDAEGSPDKPLSAFYYRELDYSPPAYAGLLRASKTISNELQEVLYKECVFRAYLSKHRYRLVTPPEPREFARIQKMEIVLDNAIYLANPITLPGTDVRGFDSYYGEWFEALGGSGADHEFCRIRIINIAPETFYLTPVCRQLLYALKSFTGFGTVIVELGDLPDSQAIQLPASHGANPQVKDEPPEEPMYAGARFEALKRTIKIELEPYLGNCIYYDRGLLRCVEFRPRTDDPIPPGCAPYIEAWDE